MEPRQRSVEEVLPPDALLEDIPSEIFQGGDGEEAGRGKKERCGREGEGEGEGEGDGEREGL